MAYFWAAVSIILALVVGFFIRGSWDEWNSSKAWRKIQKELDEYVKRWRKR